MMGPFGMFDLNRDGELDPAEIGFAVAEMEHWEREENDDCDEDEEDS